MLGYVFQLSTSDTRKATCQLRCLHRTDHRTSSRTHVLNTGRDQGFPPYDGRCVCVRGCGEKGAKLRRGGLLPDSSHLVTASQDSRKREIWPKHSHRPIPRPGLGPGPA
jgi:hypothetical protein